MELRPYQQEIVDSVEAGWKEFQRQLVVAPTGSGKTIVFSHLAQRTRPGRTLILTHRDELVRQAKDKLVQSTGLVAEIEKAEESASLTAPVVVASVQTMVRRLDKWPKEHFSLVVADEAHHAISDSWQTVLQHFNAETRVVGVTATPDRGDKKNLGRFFDNVAAEIALFDLIHQGYLCPITIHSLPLQIDLSSVGVSHGDFVDTQLDHALTPYLGEIAKQIRFKAWGRKTLVFLPLIATSKAFADLCRNQLIRAEHVDGNSPDRAEILERFARGDIELLSNAMLLTEGYDCPDIDCVVVLRPTKSRPLYAQMVGRGTRVAEGKDDLLLLDFLWMHETHSLVGPASLISSNEGEAKAITTASSGRGMIDLETLCNQVRQERESKLLAELEAKKKRQARVIDAAEFCLTVHADATAEWEDTMRWHSDRPTEKQLAFLLKHGIEPGSIRSKGHASGVIDVIMSRFRGRLATPRQVALLRKLKHPHPDQCTMEQASDFMDSRFNKQKEPQWTR